MATGVVSTYISSSNAATFKNDLDITIALLSKCSSYVVPRLLRSIK